MPTPVVTQAAVNSGGFNVILIGSDNTLEVRGTGLLPRPGSSGLQLSMPGLSFSGYQLLSNPDPSRATFRFQASGGGFFGVGFLRIIVINTDGTPSAPRELQVTYLDDTLLRGVHANVRLTPVSEPAQTKASTPAVTTAEVNGGGAIVVGAGQINRLLITGSGFDHPTVGLNLNPPDLDFVNIQVSEWTSTTIKTTFEARFAQRVATECDLKALGRLTVTVVNSDGGRAERTIEVLYPEPPVLDTL